MLNKLILLTVTTVVGEALQAPIDQMVSRQKLVSDSQTKTKYSQSQQSNIFDCLSQEKYLSLL